jgi:hypothetical protein
MHSTTPNRIKFEALAESLRQQINRLMANPSPSLLETDLAKETLRELYKVIDLLAQPGVYTPEMSEAATVRPEPVADIILPNLPIEAAPAKNMEMPPVKVIEPYLVITPESSIIPEPAKDEKPELPPVEIAPILNFEAGQNIQEARKTVYADTLAKAAQAGQQPTIGSRYSAEQSLSDRIAQAGQPTRLSDQLQRKPLEDLRVSIGLNERFAFINALFGGNQQSFYAAVDKLNAAGSFPDATSELNNLQATYGWEPQHMQVIEFTELVKRRFGI